MSMRMMNAALSSVAALAALVGVSALAGCGSGDVANYKIKHVFDPCEPVVLVAEKGSSAAERKSVDEAAALWNSLANTKYTTEDTADTAKAPHIAIHFDPAGDNYHGLYDDERVIVFINSNISDDRARMVTVAHEVGHTLGLVHIDPATRVSLMNPANMKTEPNEGDKAALVQLWGTCPQSK